MDYKQVILVRTDLKLPKGKLAAQVAHASVEAALKASKSDLSKWRNQGQKKVVLKISSKEEVFKFKTICEDENVVCAVITDAGKTVIAPGTVTCIGIGPDSEEKIDSITGSLSML